MSLRGVTFVSEVEAGSRIWGLFFHRLKKDVVEDWYVAKLRGDLAEFERRVLVGGLLGVVDDGGVRWAGILEEVGYRYWDLFD